MVEKTVVAVRVGENVGKLKNEGLPSDFWSWRKYGQKPIKGSPYPRCSFFLLLQNDFLIHMDPYSKSLVVLLPDSAL